MSYEEQDVIWRVALASYDPREMRVWTRYLEERNPAIRCTGYRSSRTLLERLEQGDVDVLVLGGRLEDMDSIQFLPKIRGLARKPLVLLRDDGRNEKSAVESLSQEDACYLIRQATLEDMLQELRVPAHRPAESLEKRCERIYRSGGIQSHRGGCGQRPPAAAGDAGRDRYPDMAGFSKRVWLRAQEGDHRPPALCAGK